MANGQGCWGKLPCYRLAYTPLTISQLINDILPAKTIVDNMVNEAAQILQHNASLVKVHAKL